MVEVGKRYYFIAHAYYHLIGEVTEVLGVRRVALKDVIQVHSCPRNWTQFFAEGCKGDTRFDVIGETAETSFLLAHVWKHGIPTKKGN